MKTVCICIILGWQAAVWLLLQFGTMGIVFMVLGVPSNAPLQATVLPKLLGLLFLELPAFVIPYMIQRWANSRELRFQREIEQATVVGVKAPQIQVDNFAQHSVSAPNTRKEA